MIDEINWFQYEIMLGSNCIKRISDGYKYDLCGIFVYKKT